MKQAEQIVNELATSRSLLEIQYENEVGTGLGPTMEFYTLVSKDLQRADLTLWKGESVKITSEDVMEAEEDDLEGCIDYVFAPAGLFPLPMPRNVKSSHKTKIKSKFNFVGKFIAKAVLDNRMVDLPFSLPFYQWLLKEESNLTSQDLRNIDPTIASTVSQLEGNVKKKLFFFFFFFFVFHNFSFFRVMEILNIFLSFFRHRSKETKSGRRSQTQSFRTANETEKSDHGWLPSRRFGFRFHLARLSQH